MPSLESELTDALLVIVLTPSIRNWLEQHDPQALQQAERAVLHADNLDPDTRHDVLKLHYPGR
jgi:hypothetical protein